MLIADSWALALAGVVAACVSAAIAVAALVYAWWQARGASSALAQEQGDRQKQLELLEAQVGVEIEALRRASHSAVDVYQRIASFDPDTDLFTVKYRVRCVGPATIKDALLFFEDDEGNPVHGARAELGSLMAGDEKEVDLSLPFELGTYSVLVGWTDADGHLVQEPRGVFVVTDPYAEH